MAFPKKVAFLVDFSLSAPKPPPPKSANLNLIVVPLSLRFDIARA